MQLAILSGGAVQAVVAAVRPAFEAAHGCELAGTFGAVGFMRDRLLHGEPCDVLVLTAALIDELERDGAVIPGSARAVGTVATGIAVREGCPAVAIADGEELRATFAAARGIFVPDMRESTAGRHAAMLFERMGLAEALAARIHEHPNGATAMGALASSAGDGLIGCTQATEILAVPGVTLVGELPAGFGLETVYVAAVTASAREPRLAAAFIEALTGPASEVARLAAGFRV